MLSSVLFIPSTARTLDFSTIQMNSTAMDSGEAHLTVRSRIPLTSFFKGMGVKVTSTFWKILPFCSEINNNKR